MHYFGIPRHTQSMIKFRLSISGNPSENCIVGMLLTRSIASPNTVSVEVVVVALVVTAPSVREAAAVAAAVEGSGDAGVE